ncbi:uncharacterized protein LOC143632771 [Bidens hawaiensis]|uniref:uncharacterized protein LOC143632771 n=1 Tax=Bidens hawaiensis TaxID=980011 RepID=UPI0040493CDF
MEVNSTTATTTTTTACSQCVFIDHKILHTVRLNGTFRRLCTTCLLRLHRESFCPSCLTVYHGSPPDTAVFCQKCGSSSHRTCVSPLLTGSTRCATCVNPSRLVFNPNSNRIIDVTAARLLVAAAEISMLSMKKAEEDAAMEVDWRVKEAADWRKKAKDDVNRFVKLVEEIDKNTRDYDYYYDNVVVDDDGIEATEALNEVYRMMEI